MKAAFAAAFLAAAFSVVSPASADGVGKLSKKDVFDAQSENAVVVFAHRPDFLRYAGTPTLIWAKIEAEGGPIAPYPKKEVSGFGASLKRGSKPSFYAFTLPAGRHAICEFYLAPPNGVVYSNFPTLTNAPAFDLAPGAVTYIGEIAVRSRSVVTYSDNETAGDSYIGINDTPVAYLKVDAPGDEEARAALGDDIRAVLAKKYPGVGADIVIADARYIDLTAPGEGAFGFTAVENPDRIAADDPEIAAAAARAGRYAPECLPAKE